MFNLIQNELKKQENINVTENGAIGYQTSNSALLDLNYAVSSLRQSSEEEIITLFDKAYNENREYTLKWLFYSRDIREGLGERRLFRICYRYLAEVDEEAFRANLFNITEYGRWDDMVSLIGLNDELDYTILMVISTQLKIDLNNCDKGEPISLLAKWLPSENASSKDTKLLAKKIRKAIGFTPKEYRQILSKLRKYLNVVEVRMCNNEWNEIDYEKVPSLANLKYKNAFLRHDELRRKEYLDSVEKGNSKMNMKAATPVDIVSKYTMGRNGVKSHDETLELAWKNLKNIQVKDTMVVADGSGSMMVHVSGKTTALDVANALAIYTSEHNSGVYKDKYITFSQNPQFVDLSVESTLKEKLMTSRRYAEIANTNIEAVFRLILNVAITNEIPADEMISNILIISDMEFDRAQRGYWGNASVLTKPLFKVIEDDYNEAGYQLPKLIFWNVNSRTKTIPLIENELGVTLVSGFSQNVLQMVMSNKYDPFEVLRETLDSGRYSQVKF